MKKQTLLMIALLVVIALLCAACGGSADGSGSIQIGDGSNPTESIHISVDFNLNIDAEDGKDADGFTWENNFSEITITGYIGASNELTVPNTINGKPVTKIADGALKGFSALKSIVIPGSVTSIRGVFEDCTSLESVVIYETGLVDMTDAFKNCTSLKTVNVPSTVTEMDGAFYGCASLESDIVVPEGVIYLRNTFSGCKALKKVVVASTVTDMVNAFSGCTSLTEVNVPAGVKDLRNTFCKCESLQSVALPEGVTSLQFTFAFCTSLNSVNIPNTVSYLEGTFEGCTSLTDIQVPDSVYNMKETFKDCTSLVNVNIPKGTTYLERTFIGCTALKKITIPANVSGLQATFHNCTALEEVVFENVSGDVTATMECFNGCTSLNKLDLPYGFQFYDSGESNGYGCIALEELTVRTYDDYFDLYIGFGNWPSLKTVTVLSASDNLELYTDSEYEEYYLEFDGDGASWYDTLLAEARDAADGGYRYYETELDNGTPCRKLTTYHKNGGWTYVDVTVIESNAQVGNQVIYTCYTPALIGEDLRPGVVLEKIVCTYYVIGYRPTYNENFCGAEYYADCVYSETIEINGVEYPLEMFTNDSED